MAIVLDIYRSKLPEPEGRWWAILSRNKHGAVHLQRDVTDLFEGRFQSEIDQKIQEIEFVWKERLEFEKARAETLHNRLQQVLADTHAEAVASARFLQEKEREWQQSSDARAKEVSSQCSKVVQEKMEMITRLQEEVRQKVSQNRALMQAAEKDTADFLAYREKVNQELSNGRWGDEEVIHEARRVWKLGSGLVPYEMLPWYCRWFRKPDQDFMPYEETTSQHKNLCRECYINVLLFLRERLKVS